MKIKYQISIVFITLSILLISLLAINFYISGKKILLKEISNDLDIISNDKELFVETHLNRTYQIATLIASDRSIRKNLYNYSLTDKKEYQVEINNSLGDYGNALEGIDKVNIYSDSGKIIASSDNQNIDNYYSRPERLSQRKEGNFYRSVFYRNNENKLTISVIVPAFQENNMIGIIEVEHDASDLIRLVEDTTGLGNTGESYMIDRKTQTYLTPLRFDSGLVFHKIKEKLLERQFNKPWVAEDYKGEKAFFLTRTLESQDWEVITKMDMEEILHPIELLKKELALFYVLAIIVAILFSFILGNYLAKPLKNIIACANKMSEGDFSIRAHISLRNEIGILARSFNKMASKLENTIIELHKSNESLGKYAYVITHDLRSPLNSLTGLIQIIREQYKDKVDQEGQKMFDMQQEKINRMNSLIVSVLESARENKKKIKEPLRVDQIIKEVLEDINPPASIRVSVHPDFPVVQYPKISLIQIYQNLIGNSVKYMDKSEGMIELGFEEKDKEYLFFIRDNGPGIKKEDFDRIFIMFEAVNTFKKDSSGIGLSIVKKIVEDNNGKIWLESEIGKGAVFFFTIPK